MLEKPSIETVPYVADTRMHNQLTYAEAQQLSADYEANPEQFELVQYFSVAYKFERGDAELRLGEWRNAILEYNYCENIYADLVQRLDHGGSAARHEDQKIKEQVFLAACAAGGAVKRKYKEQAAARRNDFLEVARQLSGTLADLCVSKLNGQSIMLLGRKYEYSRGYLTTVVPHQNEKPYIIVFGSTDDYMARREEWITELPPQLRAPEKGYINRLYMPGYENWGALLRALTLITKF